MPTPVTLNGVTYQIPLSGETDWGTAINRWIVAANAQILSGSNGFLYSVKQAGAVGDGVADDTTAFTTALNANKLVMVPPGTYKLVSQISIPQNTTLQLLPGAQLRIMQPISMNADDCHLVGAKVALDELTALPANSTIKWIGGNNSSMINLATTHSNISSSIRGISLSGNGASGMTGILVGGAGQGGVWLLIADGCVYETFIGIEFVAGTQQSTVRNMILQNKDVGTNYDVVGSIGLATGVRVTSGSLTAHHYQDVVIQGFETGWQAGNATGVGGCGANCVMDGRSVIENLPANGGCAIKLLNNGYYNIHDVHIENSTASGSTTRAIQIGSTTSIVTGALFSGCTITNIGAGNSVLVEGFAWDGLIFLGNFFDFSAATGGNNICFLNTGGGSGRKGGYWIANTTRPPVTGGVAEPDFHNNDSTGFNFTTPEHRYLDGVSNNLFPAPKYPSFTLTVANNANTILAKDYLMGWCMITDTSANNATMAMFYGTGHLVTVGPTSNTANLWSATAGTANAINLYWDAGTSSYRIENKTGGSKNFTITLLSQG